MPSPQSSPDAGTARDPRVAFQGELGAFSELAIRQAWPAGAVPQACRTFGDAIASVELGDAEFAVIPVENAVVGPVHDATAALDASAARVRQVMDFRVPIHLCVMAPRDVELGELRVVRSHPMALAQCRIFLARHPWLSAEPHDDTAGAALYVADINDATLGAVASEAAAAQYGLAILARNIEDVRGNWTRFVVVERRPRE
jgi:prephenate dehydratase